MKALILAGGEGTRLRPLSLLTPKPMLSLFDRPLLEHLIDLLRRSGFTDLCITVRYLSQQILDYFGDGKDFGVSIIYEQETEPLGTAGSVKQCQSFIGEDDFLVISGDAALDFDLRSFWEHHRLHGGPATILVHSSDNPMEFGLVVTDSDHCVSAFMEKPGPENLCSELINTGIYALSSEILTHIPVGKSFDFGTELFPALIQDGVRIHTYQTEGYWNDIGTCSAYLQTCHDVIDGKLHLPLVEQAYIRNQCYISPNAVVSPNAQLLPYSIIGGKSVVEDECRIEASVLMGCFLERGSYVSGSILCNRVHLQTGSRILDGCILGDGVAVSVDSILARNSIIWPEKNVSDYESGNDDKQAFLAPHFHADGSINLGQINRAIMDLAFRFGFCNSGASKIAISNFGGKYAEILSSAIQNGCRLSGKECVVFDAEQPAAASMLSMFFCFPMTFFIHQLGKKITLYAYGQDGKPICRKVQRILERAEADLLPVCRNPMPVRSFRETMNVYYRLLCPSVNLTGFRVSVGNPLKNAFLLFNADLVPPSDGTLYFDISADGYSALARDEDGLDMTHTDLLVLWVILAMQDGAEVIRVPQDSSPVLDRIAACFHGTILRGRFLPTINTCQIPTITDGASLLLSLSSIINQRKIRLTNLRKSLPVYYHFNHYVETQNQTGMILRELSSHYNGQMDNGLKLKKGEVTAILTPLSLHRLRVFLESETAELADDFFCELSEYFRK